ncbi:formate dehydrogenase accessory protein FdhE, partial [Candidatus Bathyarchaeota archaeon]|nr:formate dehydrogenase accessory protein FdhE [Candidatus Bathyarchaeota archaeon]
LNLKYLSITERLKIIADSIPKHEDLREYLELQSKILHAQKNHDTESNDDAKTSWVDQLPLNLLEQKSLKNKKPIIHYLNLSLFNEGSLLSIFRKSIHLFISMDPAKKGLETLINNIDDGKISFMKLMDAALSDDITPIIKYAKKFKIEPDFLLFLINISLQPFIEEISKKVSSSFYDKWWRVPCPICGKVPSISRIRNRKRYLLCNFCGAEYPSDYFICVNCENKEPNSLNYMNIEGKPEFQIDFCTKCNHYLKVIIEKKLKEPIPKCIEDILTLNLDIKALNAGLIRND